MADTVFFLFLNTCVERIFKKENYSYPAANALHSNDFIQYSQALNRRQNAEQARRPS